MKQTSGFYPRVKVDTSGRAAVGQAGGVLLTETVRGSGLDAGHAPPDYTGPRRHTRTAESRPDGNRTARLRQPVVTAKIEASGFPDMPGRLTGAFTWP